MDQLCFLCLKECSNQCDHCKTPFCSKEHLQIHRPHESCFPFKIQQNETVGRFVVATRDIEPLELILEEPPAVMGPDHDTVPVCVECVSRVDGSFLCPDCQMPLCGPDCYEQGQFHRQNECSVLADTPTGVKVRVAFGRDSKASGKEAFAPEYQFLVPLRILCKKKNDPELWGRIQLLMDHDEERRKEEYWNMFQHNVVDFMRQRLGLDFTEEEIFRVIGIIRTNAFCIETPAMKAQSVGARAIYPTFSFLSHSCVCNARYSVMPNFNVQLRAQKAIRKGEEITIQYISFMFGQMRRKTDIRECWFFECTCARCMDPSELGSFMSAMRCSDPECPGDVLPPGSAEIDEDWICSKCSKTTPAQTVKNLCNKLDDILHQLYGREVLQYEKLHPQFLKKLKPNHYLMLTIEKFLGDLYGLCPGFEYKTLSTERLEAKIKYLKHFIQVIGQVDAGYTKWLGLCLHSVSRPILFKANREFNSKKITKDDFISILRGLSQDLKECIKCLECEPEGSKEADVTRLAKSDLRQINEIITFSQFI